MAKNNNTKETIYGINTIDVLIKTNPIRIIEIFCEQKDRNVINPKIKSICELAFINQISIQYVKPGTLHKWFEGEQVNHQGIAAHIQPKPYLVEDDLLDLININNNLTKPIFLVLDNIQDPRNLGACIRSAAGFNATAVIISRNASCDITAAVKKVASGGVELVPIAKVGNLASCLKQIQQQGVWVVTLDAANEKELSSIDLTIPTALVLGSEDQGVRKIIKQNSDFLAKIPMPNSNMDSLNLSVAAGICLYEVTRQRIAKKF